ncbi:hypothetical protein WDZ92_52140 [Nostoc sp. NIES-2111]
MARLVIPKSTSNAAFASARAEKLPPDTYTDRVVKYIPAESVTFFVLVDKVLIAYFGIDKAEIESASLPTFVFFLSGAFILLGLILTPVYLRRRALPGQPWTLHASISAIAFVIWTYTLSGSFFLLMGWHNAFVSAILAPLFTYVAAAFEPSPSDIDVPKA